ncbi:AMIN-like domain-containing (lipo)protein [Lolliginicoccus suaedae]|uniref:AMIN-like domain-containing (lipo)protein n=1 Tax=Lolliginicoccus suaedae TaxID=2605429 RepID=UPI001F20E0A1|nr:hypothetical protein [Lolliginicoccus suaedae]
MSTTTIRRFLTSMMGSLLLAVGLVAGPGILGSAAAGASPYCGITWGSLDKSWQHYSSGTVTNVRSGRHACFDRLVVDVAGPVAGYNVRYVDVVRAQGSGFEVPLRGGAQLQVVVHAPAYNEHGNSTYWPADRSELVNVWGYDTFRQVAFAGTFEGQTSLGLGVRARLPFRVFTLEGPGTSSRVVIDVAHYWQ